MKHNLVDYIVREELFVTDRGGKLLIAAMIFNIPVVGFIPYLTQAFTIILLAFFLKSIVRNNKKQKLALKNNKVKYVMKPYGYVLVLATMCFQVIWIPYIMQFVTLIALGVIYATMTNYKLE